MKPKVQIILHKGQKLYDKKNDATCKIIWTDGIHAKIRYDKTKSVVTEDVSTLISGREFLTL